MPDFLDLLPSFSALLITCLLMYGLHWIFTRNLTLRHRYAFMRTVILFLFFLAGLISLVLMLPIDENTKTHLLGTIGLIISAALTLSSTTLVGNAMAGLMLRMIRNLRPGLFIETEKHFGRVTEIGLLHTEIQTADSSLTTLPNTFLVSYPVTVLRGKGTIISADVSLGYDIPRKDIEQALMEAASTSGLETPYVLILSLGDYSVTYRCAGFLQEVKYVLTARSMLCGEILDSLHRAGIEIVSPTFMNQRVYPTNQAFIPVAGRPMSARLGPKRMSDDEGAREDVIFSKAERAALGEELKSRLTTIEVELHELEDTIRNEKSDNRKAKLDEIHKRKSLYRTFLMERIDSTEEENHTDSD